MPRLISMPLWPSGRLERKPSSCWKSSRFKVQLYFWTIPDTVNRSLSSSRRVGAMFTTRKVSRNIRSFRLCKSSKGSLCVVAVRHKVGAGVLSMSYPARAAFFWFLHLHLVNVGDFGLDGFYGSGLIDGLDRRVMVISASISKSSASSLSEALRPKSASRRQRPRSSPPGTVG